MRRETRIMKHRKMIRNLSRSILGKIPHVKGRHKVKQQLKTALPLIYAGTWLFIDDLSNKHHKLEITVDLRILIDSHELPGKIEHLDESSLVFLDTYGYHLRITAENLHPVSVYDEAESRSYDLSEYYK